MRSEGFLNPFLNAAELCDAQREGVEYRASQHHLTAESAF